MGGEDSGSKASRKAHLLLPVQFELVAADTPGQCSSGHWDWALGWGELRQVPNTAVAWPGSPLIEIYWHL